MQRKCAPGAKAKLFFAVSEDMRVICCAVLRCFRRYARYLLCPCRLPLPTLTTILRALRSHRYIAVSLASFSSPAIQVRAHVASSADSVVFGLPARHLQPSHVLYQVSSSTSMCIKSSRSTPVSSLVAFVDDSDDKSVAGYWRIVLAHSFSSNSIAENVSVAGREQERDVIDTALAKFLLGMSRQAVLITGPAGHGKSTLTDEVARKTAGANAVVLARSAASSMMGLDMFQMWAPLFSKLLDSAQFTKQNIRSHIRGSNHSLLKMVSLLNHVLPSDLAFEENDETQKLSVTAARTTTITLCEALMRALVEKLGKVVLVVEDIHWCTSNELNLLVAVSGIENGLMLIVNCRPFDGQEAQKLVDLAELKLAMTEQVELGSLTSSDVEALARMRIDSKDDDSALLEEFLEIARIHAKGLPLVVYKLLDQLEEIGSDVFLRRMGDTSAVGSDSQRRRSSASNAVGIFQMEFKHLSGAEYKILSLVAVYGGEVSVEQMCAILNSLVQSPGEEAYTEASVSSSVDILVAKSLMLRAEGCFVVQHKIIEDAVIATTVRASPPYPNSCALATTDTFQG